MTNIEYVSALRTIAIASAATSAISIVLVVWMFLSVTRFLFHDLEKRVEELEDRLDSLASPTETTHEDRDAKQDSRVA